MPYYKKVIDDLIKAGERDGAREVASRLLSLRHRLGKEIPERNVQSSVLLATWNLREFGADHKSGKRLDESLLYIAEIISHFDLVALQEINQNLDNLQRLMKLLGSWWDYLVTDVTLGTSGNSERIAFVYDGRKVQFDHLAGELALPPVNSKPSRQPARSPFICAFRVGWRRIALCSVHIYCGEAKADDPVRVEEIGAVAQALAARNRKRMNAADGEPESVVLLGDFNIFNKFEDDTAKALAKNDFVIPDALMKVKKGGNLARDKHFDQIAFHDPRARLKTSCGGIFDFQQVICGPDDAEAYRSAMARSAPDKFDKVRNDVKAMTKFYKTWRTFQISDHLPLWVELKTDFANNYLGSVLKHAGGSAAPAGVDNASTSTDSPPPIANAPAGGPAKARKAGRKRKKAA